MYFFQYFYKKKFCLIYYLVTQWSFNIKKDKTYFIVYFINPVLYQGN